MKKAKIYIPNKSAMQSGLGKSIKWILEFETKIDEIFVNGVDMIEWNDQGQIITFKVMIRPYQAVEKVKEKMQEALEALKNG